MRGIRLGDICTIEKGKIGIQAAVPGNYPLVTTAEERSSHNEFHFEGEAVCIPLVSATGHGHASIKRLHYEKGRFCVGSILAACVPKNDLKTSARFLFWYLSLFKDSILVPLMQGSANVSLKIKDLEKVEVPDISIDEQNFIVDLVERVKVKQEALQKEITQHQSYLQLLRQTILQEAVQGKLTKQDERDEPASELLKRIKAEKQALVKEGKLKKEKELPPITEEEIPFELPKGWVWCRFRDIAIIRSNLVDPTQYRGLIQIGPDVIEKGTGRLLEKRTVEEAEVKSWNHYFYPNQIIYSKIRPNLSKAVIVDFEGLCSADMYPVEPLINIRYLHYFVLSATFLQQVVKTDNRIKMPKINQEELNEVIISLPPLDEQQRIVAKVQQLQQQLNNVEAQVQQSQQYAQQLLQTVLKEAFAGKEKQYEMNEELSLAAED